MSLLAWKNLKRRSLSHRRRTYVCERHFYYMTTANENFVCIVYYTFDIISLTTENEVNNKFPFIDVCVERGKGGHKTSNLSK